MLNIIGMNRLYYIRNFTDMRCKYSRILAVIRHQLGREPERDDITYKIDLEKDSTKIDLKVQMSDGYNVYTFLDGELEKTDHLI